MTNSIANTTAGSFIDKCCDYIPVVSTLTNLVAIVVKIALIFFRPERITNAYLSHINNKPFLRCVILLFPFASVIVGISDFIQNRRRRDISKLAIFKPDLSPIKEVQTSFIAFLSELEKDIFPLYATHETTFDEIKVHGRMHIARALIFGEVIGRYHFLNKEPVDFDYFRRAIGLHDAGRKGNGPDQWEKDSSALLEQHLISKGMREEEAKQKSSIICDKESHKINREGEILQSADCLDIMRPCAGWGGRSGFNEKLLTFSGDAEFRKQLIEEAWLLIKITENKKQKPPFTENETIMLGLLEVIRENQRNLPVISYFIL